MTRAPLPTRLLSAALSVVEAAAVLAVGVVVVVRALARGGPGVLDACGAATCPHASIVPDPSRPGYDRCEDCGGTDFPATPEAAGACPACGEYGDCECVPAGPRPHCAAWVILPSGRAIGMSPFGDPMTGGKA